MYCSNSKKKERKKIVYNNAIKLYNKLVSIYFNDYDNTTNEEKERMGEKYNPNNLFPTRHLDVLATSQRRLSVRPSDVAGTSQMKHPTTSRWNVAKTSQWCVSTTSYWNVMTSQKDVTTTPHHYISMTSQTSLK